MKEKNYEFIYLDKLDNELQREVRECRDKKEAFKIAKLIFWQSNMNDLFKIKVKKVC